MYTNHAKSRANRDYKLISQKARRYRPSKRPKDLLAQKCVQIRDEV